MRGKLNWLRCGVVAVMVVLTTGSGVTWGQLAGLGLDDKFSIETKVFALQRSQARVARDTLSELFRPNENLAMTVDQRTNSIIVRGPKFQLDEIEAFLMKLDQEADVEPQERVHFLRIPWTNQLGFGGDPSGALLVLTSKFPTMQVHTDMASGLAVIYGTNEAAEAAAQLLNEYAHMLELQNKQIKVAEQQQREEQAKLEQMKKGLVGTPVHLRVYWLLASEKDHGLPPAAKFANVSSVLDEIVELGLASRKEEIGLAANLTLLGSAKSTAEKPFRSGGRAAGYLLSVDGIIHSAGNQGEPAEVSIDIKVRRDNGGDGAVTSELSTRISAEPGQFVVLGSTPLGDQVSVFVVQVVPAVKKVAEKQN